MQRRGFLAALASILPASWLPPSKVEPVGFRYKGLEIPNESFSVSCVIRIPNGEGHTIAAGTPVYVKDGKAYESHTT